GAGQSASPVHVFVQWGPFIMKAKQLPLAQSAFVAQAERSGRPPPAESTPAESPAVASSEPRSPGTALAASSAEPLEPADAAEPADPAEPPEPPSAVHAQAA